MTDAEKRLHRLIANIAKDQNYTEYESKELNTDGANYSSILFQVKLKAEGKDDLHLFAKVGTMAEKMREAAVGKIYETEYYFYSELSEVYNKLQEDSNVPEEHRLIWSKFYGYDPTYLEETIVLEDLTAAGFGPFDRFSEVNWEQATKIVTELAKLHALSFAYKEKMPEEYQKATDSRKNNFSMSDEISGAIENVTKSTLNSIEDETHREWVKKFIEDNMTADKFGGYYKPIRREVLMHGDFRCSNMMHKVNEKGETVVRVLDYQTISLGNAANDLIYFIFTATGEEFRRLHFDELVNYYYDQLAASLRRLGVDPSRVYPREDFDAEFKHIFHFGLGVSMFTLPIVLVQADNAPDFSGLTDLNDLCIKPSAGYQERLNGIIRDYVRWGVLKP